MSERSLTSATGVDISFHIALDLDALLAHVGLDGLVFGDDGLATTSASGWSLLHEGETVARVARAGGDTFMGRAIVTADAQAGRADRTWR